MSDAIVIVGGGHAAAQLCAALAEAGQGARVHLACEEQVHPYQRPPLSKAYLKQATETPQLFRDAAWFASQGIQVHLGEPVAAIDRAARRIRFASGKELAYGKLVLATGTRARSLPSLHGPLQNVRTLRNVADADAMRACLLRQERGALTVIGGGFIGLEVAATARQLGWEVHVLEAAPRLLARAVSPELSAHVLQFHRDLGTTVHLYTSVGHIEQGATRLVSLQVNGARHEVDEVLLGIGAVPETALAHAADLAIDNGVRVDAHMVTSDPDILAAGDCTSFHHEGRHIRLESVQNATDQAKVAAATLLGTPRPYQPTPFFWSEQGGLRLQMAGLWRAGLECVSRPGAAPTSFSLFHYEGDRLVAVESVNAPVDHMMARKILEKGTSPDRRQVMDPTVALKTLV